MKRFAWLVLFAVFLCGCQSSLSAVDRPMLLRNAMLEAEQCIFDAHITADYGEKCFDFMLRCHADSSGTLSFSVQNPAAISGISGSISYDRSYLEFDDKMLAFEPLADGQISPVLTPWLFVRCLTSGYIHAAGEDGEFYHVKIHDSFQGEALEMDIWLDHNNLPIMAEIIWSGRRIMSMKVEKFTLL